jgi:outer membrane protein TolC
MIREAEYNLSASIHQYNVTKNMVYFRIQDAFSRVRAQRELVELLRDTIIPQTRQAYEVTQTSYSTGMSDFTGMIDAWRKWLAYNLQYHRALGELDRSYSDLEQQIGMSISEAGAGNAK